jgi:hypothetical protein
VLAAKVTQFAECGPRRVALVELELGAGESPARHLWIVVLDLPPDSRGRPGHWCRTETELPRALELYDQALREHVVPAAE